MSDKPARPLLTVKHMIPPPREGMVPRERLVRQLREAETRLTVVVAPAGWGKTSLLSQWAAGPEEERRIAWVSLDEGDDEPARFAAARAPRRGVPSCQPPPSRPP